jgi:hypothetical protein
VPQDGFAVAKLGSRHNVDSTARKPSFVEEASEFSCFKIEQKCRRTVSSKVDNH